MNEAAFAGQVDATNTGIVPTLNLLGASDDWIIVSRLIDFPVALVAPDASGIRSIDDLKGKNVGVPFGGGSHPYLLQRLDEHNLSDGTGPDEVELVNLKPTDQALALARGDVDVVATWEPQTAIALGAVPSSVIDRDIHVGFLSVRKSYAEKHPQEVIRLLMAYFEANLFVARHRDLTDRWFIKASGFDPDLLARIETIENNLKVDSLEQIKMEVTPEDIARTQRVADVMYQHDLLTRKVDVRSRVDMTYLRKAREELFQMGPKTDSVKVGEYE
jgi:sulfonate transport system substrate-binding protein